MAFLLACLYSVIAYNFCVMVDQELSARFKERNALQGPMEDEIKAASSLAVHGLHMLLLLLLLLLPADMHLSDR